VDRRGIEEKQHDEIQATKEEAEPDASCRRELRNSFAALGIAGKMGMKRLCYGSAASNEVSIRYMLDSGHQCGLRKIAR
jgi:hypothetical protein